MRDWSGPPPIHHERISAFHASEDGAAGHFDVLENDDGFNVIDGSGFPIDTLRTLDEAREAAIVVADSFDADYAANAAD
jgi:hypothetical protein